jgi:predicted ArsR family transcriptional regulator
MSKKIAAVGNAMKIIPRTRVSKPRVTKLNRLDALMWRQEGATIEQLGKALEWQMHSVRRAVAGWLKKKGITVTSEQQKSGPRPQRRHQASRCDTDPARQ